MSDRLLIKPELFQWAQERSGMSVEELCNKFPKYREWIEGTEEPTIKQLEKFAGQTFTPLGFLFLEKPPEERLPIHDFRTITDRLMSRPSPHLLDTIYTAQLRQEWMRGFLIEQGEQPLSFVGSHTLKDQPNVVAADIRKTLGLSAQWGRAFSTWEEALRTLIEKIEDVGVLVMINGVVENNTRRPLNVEEFRGFALTDSYAPLIFINGTDAKAAQMFTIVHELAHLWLGEGGVSDFKELVPSENKVEIFCNSVAAEFLVPAGEMKSAWDEVKNREYPFQSIGKIFKVSPVVAARRALDLHLISRTKYFEFYNIYRRDAAKRKAQTGGGGNFYLTVGVRLGKRFPSAVYSAAKEGRLPYRDAYQLTGLSGSTYDRFGKELGFAL